MEEKENPLAPYEGQFDVVTRKQMVAEMLRQLRKTKGLQQKEVAQILGISPQTYNGYEKGRNEPPIETLVRLSYLYGISVDLLVQRDRFHAYGQSAIESVRIMEQELAAIREEFPNSPMAENKQLQALINAMDNLTAISRKVVEKHNL